ncbi:MAG: aminoacyl-tRNA hydrolase [Candidatus Levybacteria bacterium RIFCSPHIGHO2_02_FULL_37_10]|nr:MAG: aminoacyl-tRNA hydrolase [Candidatus Levybacteria bacterium RIFCSPHIGHO2_02_FULL_37_10]
MKLIIGLGNPGKKYEKTRHNMGFMVADALGNRVKGIGDSWKHEEKFKSEILKINHPLTPNPYPLILVKPLTYMNNSGLAVGLIANFYKIKPEDIWVVHDDIDLLLGSMKIRFGGASAGHKGVDSIINSLGTDGFWRFRIGIASKRSEIGIKTISGERMKRKNIDDFVLGEFIKEERNRVKEIIRQVVRAIEIALIEGMDKAMNKFNTR